MNEKAKAEFQKAAASLFEEANSLTEALRVRKVIDLNILDTPPEEIYDDIVALAATTCQTNAAVLSFIGKDLAFRKASFCGPIGNMPRELAFCNTAIKNPKELLIIPDATLDARFREHPQVVNGNIRFYAGVPLVDQDGFALGALCVVSDHSREITEEEKDSIRKLARIVVYLVTRRLHNWLE